MMRVLHLLNSLFRRRFRLREYVIASPRKMGEAKRSMLLKLSAQLGQSHHLGDMIEECQCAAINSAPAGKGHRSATAFNHQNEKESHTA